MPLAPEPAVGETERQEAEFKQRAALLTEALGHLPPDAVTLSALIDVAVSTAFALTLDPSTARMMLEARNSLAPPSTPTVRFSSPAT